MNFTFEQKDWELSLSGLKPGSKIDAVRLLALLEGEDEEEAELALSTLEERGIALDITDLPADSGSGDMALRLRREAQLVKEGTLLNALDANDPLRLYLQEVAGIPAAGDPQLLAEQFAAGDESVGERIVNLMLSLVIEQAMALTNRGVLLLDLIQEGSLGLWQGLMCYRSGDYVAHCNWWIAQYQAKAVFLQARAGGVGQKLRQLLEDYQRADTKLLTSLGRNPLPEEIGAELNLTGEDAAILDKMLQQVRSQQRSTPKSSDSEIPEEEDQSAENTAYYQSRQRVQDMLSGLTDEEAQLISMRYGLEGGVALDPEQVGKKLGLTPEEVIQKETAALQKLRQLGE